MRKPLKISQKSRKSSKLKVKTQKVGTFRIPGCRKSVQRKSLNQIENRTRSSLSRGVDFLGRHWCGLVKALTSFISPSKHVWKFNVIFHFTALLADENWLKWMLRTMFNFPQWQTQMAVTRDCQPISWNFGPSLYPHATQRRDSRATKPAMFIFQLFGVSMACK